MAQGPVALTMRSKPAKSVQRADFVMAAHFYAQLPALFDNPLAQCKIIHLCIIK